MYAHPHIPPSSILHIRGPSRRASIRSNMPTSYRRVLRPIHNRRLRPCHARCKTSRDSLASLKTKRVVRLSPMTSRPPVTTTNGNIISVPRLLERPTPGSIQIDTLQSACPELNGVSVEFVRRQLTTMAPNMLEGLRVTAIETHNISELPTELPVGFSNNPTVVPPVTPTHILALSTSTQPESFHLFPIHQLPFAINCSNFPALPSSPSATVAGNRSSTATLPVIRLTVDDRDALAIRSFPLFQIYVYVKDPSALRATFLPPDWTNSMEDIIKAVSRIKGFWSIAHALNMLDDEMFGVVEECWAEALRVLDRVTR